MYSIRTDRNRVPSEGKGNDPARLPTAKRGARVEILEEVNELIRKQDAEGLRALLLKEQNKNGISNDLFLLLALTGVHERERQHGKNGIFSRYTDMDRLLREHRKLRSIVRKAEWMEEFPLRKALEEAEETGVSVYELGWAVNACCVEKEAVWEKIRNVRKE